MLILGSYHLSTRLGTWYTILMICNVVMEFFSSQIEKVPCEFIDNFNPIYPVILGGILANEDNIGYIRVRRSFAYDRLCKSK